MSEAKTMSCALQDPTIMPSQQERPYRKRRKPCIICGNPSAGVTSYIFQANGKNKIGVPFCQPRLDNHEAYATPVFENQDALDLFKKSIQAYSSATSEAK
ncbi:MAG: hypothetical protein ABSA75_03470 [Candidatus Bathyarchaeia archaeon]|jgi:hypothetical protein